MRQFKGSSVNIAESVIGLITHNPILFSRKNYILVCEKTRFFTNGYEGVVTARNNDIYNMFTPTLTVDVNSIKMLVDGDIIQINSDGLLKVLWDKKSKSNAILMTESCNCNCRMCPQPPNKHNPDLIRICKNIINLIAPNPDESLIITGGEPTLLKDDFIEVISLIKEKHPNLNCLLLTNGKSYADFDFTKRFSGSRPQYFTTCVSLHSDVDEIHDDIVGSKGSFYKTLMGLYNLARFSEKIELRVVVSKLNASHLESIAEFIFRNLPFVYHCTFMGLEMTGYASDNRDDIWADPFDYRDELSKAVSVLRRANINVSIYNTPLCLIDKSMWPFAKQSISSWKNNYQSICDSCSVRPDCCGFFTTSGTNYSKYIAPQ
jgi:His-Xaa-Ser system radical SAM maturase HxsC